MATQEFRALEQLATSVTVQEFNELVNQLLATEK